MYKPYECLVTAQNKAVAIRFKDSAYPNIIFQLGLDEYYQMLNEDEELRDSFPHHNLLPKHVVISTFDRPPYFLTKEDYEYRAASYTIPSENPISPNFCKTSCYLYVPEMEQVERIRIMEENIYYLAYKLYGPRIAAESCRIKPSFINDEIIFTLSLFTSLQKEHVEEIIENVEKQFENNPFEYMNISSSASWVKVKLTLTKPLENSKMRLSRKEVQKMLFNEVNLGGSLESTSFIDTGSFVTDSDNNKFDLLFLFGGPSKIIMFTFGERYASIYNSTSISRKKEFPFYTNAFHAFENFISKILEEDFYEEICDTTEVVTKIFFEGNFKKGEAIFPLLPNAKRELIEGLSEGLSMVLIGVDDSIIHPLDGSIRTEDNELIMTIYFD